jgi:hypothetical protein
VRTADETGLELIAANTSQALRALHLLYEDMKLNILNHVHLRPLAQLLITMALRVGWRRAI